MAQAVISWYPIVEAQVHSHASYMGFCGVKIVTGTVFPLRTLFVPYHYHYTSVPKSFIRLSSTLNNLIN